MKKIVLNYFILSAILFSIPHILATIAGYAGVIIDGGWIIIYFVLLPLISSLFIYIRYKFTYPYTGGLIKIITLNTLVLYILLGVYTWYMVGLAFMNSRWI